MNAANVVQTIQLVIAPSVMLSSCFLCQNMALGRFMRISDRLHSLVRERIEVFDKYVSFDRAYIDTLHLIDKCQKFLFLIEPCEKKLGGQYLSIQNLKHRSKFGVSQDKGVTTRLLQLLGVLRRNTCLA